MAEDQKLSPEQVERVLRRAARLDTEARDENDELQDSEGISGQELVRLGEEAGLSRAAMDRALGELRRGELIDVPDTGLGKALGSSRVVIARDVPGSVESTRKALARFMREQLMVVRRHHGERVEWEKAKGLFPGLARSLDFAQRYCFGPVERVETLVSAQGDGASITFVIDLSEARRVRLLGAGTRGLAYAGIGGLVGWLFDFSTAGIVTSGLGAAAAAGTWFGERRRYRALQERVAVGPERFLDILTQKRLGPAAELEGHAGVSQGAVASAAEVAAELAHGMAASPRGHESGEARRAHGDRDLDDDESPRGPFAMPPSSADR